MSTSALHDFVVGDAPQIDQDLCKEHRVGSDRVWRVAVTMLGHAHDGVMFMSRKYLSDYTGIPERAVRDAITVLDKSGVIKRTDFVVHPKGTAWASVHWEPTWEVSGRTLKVDLGNVKAPDEQACRDARIGRDRAWNVAFLAIAVKDASIGLLAELAGIGVRQVRAAAKAAGLAVKAGKTALVWQRKVLATRPKRPDPCHNTTPPSSNNNLPPSGEARAREGAFETPLRIQKIFRSALQDLFRRGKAMPYPGLDFGNVTPDESEVPTKDLRRASRQSSKPSRKPPRRQRPLESWTPLDSVNEYKEQFAARYYHVPGELGDSAKLAKILGKMRNQFGHDARTEMRVLDRWLDDAADINGNTHVAPWRKWIASFRTFYDAAENHVKLDHPEYQTYKDRQPKPEPEQDVYVPEEQPSAVVEYLASVGDDDSAFQAMEIYIPPEQE